jgi:hypothetical protein
MKNVCYLHHNGFLIFEQRLGILVQQIYHSVKKLLIFFFIF